MKHAVDHYYASVALKAVLDSNLPVLKQCFAKVGKVPSSIAVACLMARHKRLGAKSCMRKIPNFIIRYILSILGAPFDLLNDSLWRVDEHLTQSDEMRKLKKQAGEWNEEDDMNESKTLTVVKHRKSSTQRHTLHFCGVTFLKSYHCNGWLAMTDGPPKKYGVYYDGDDEWCWNMISQIFLNDDILMNTKLGNAFPNKCVKNCLLPLKQVEEMLRHNKYCDFKSNGGAQENIRESKRAFQILIEKLNQHITLSDAKIRKWLVNGDTLFHVASRMVVVDEWGTTKIEKNQRREKVRNYLASLSPRMSLNSKYQLPKNWKNTLIAQSKRDGKDGYAPRGAKFIVGDHSSFPSTGCYAASLDMLMKPMEFNGLIKNITLLFGKTLNCDSEFILCSCKIDNPLEEDEKLMKYSIINVSQITNIDLNPPFYEVRKSLKGSYMVTEEQICDVSPVLFVNEGEYLCLINKNGGLNLTCGLGATKRRRLLPSALQYWSIEDTKSIPFTQNQIKESSVGWKTEVEINAN
jgi:hypothetical protein